MDGESVRLEALAYWMLHKPRGVITTVDDPEGRTTVLDLIPRAAKSRARLFPVGRLDLDTEGLVLLTNDGALAHVLMHPSHGCEREYRVTARGRLSRDELRRLSSGVPLDDGMTAPARVADDRFDAGSGTSVFTLTLTEGRKRQIRRALATLGHPVVRLLRVRMGPLQLGDLGPGVARRLSPSECSALRTVVATASRKDAGSPHGSATSDSG